MAITIDQQPQLYTPVYNPMRFVLSSTNTGQDNFKYVVDVYVSGVASYTRLLFNADPTTSKCAPDVAGIIERYITYDLSHTTYDFQRCTNSIKAYEVKFGEQYGASASIATYPDLTVTGTKYAWNGVFSPPDFQGFTYTGYTMFSGVLLTNQPAQQYYRSSDENMWMYFLNDTSGSAYYVSGVVYDSSDNALSRFTLENQYQASSSYLDKMLRVAIGPDDILNSSTITLISGDPAIVNASGASYYTITLINFAGAATTATYTYTIECQFKGQDPIQVVWLNRKGGFDKFNFRMNHRTFSEVKRDTVQKNIGSLSGSSWSYATQDRGVAVFNSEITDVIQAESDWINTAQATWLQELFESPEVYYHVGDATGNMIPVIVKQTGYEIKNTLVEKLFNVSIEFSYANKRWTQRG